jgi:competence protein ComEC
MKLALYICLLALANGFALARVADGARDKFALWFFDVGQGDSELIDFGRVQILIDGGPPNGKALAGLQAALPAGDKTIDLVLLTHPQLDHFGGLIDVMERYETRLFATAGVTGSAPAYQPLKAPDITLGEGDRIRHKEYTIRFLGPSARERRETDLNKTSLVFMLETPRFKALYMGDAHGENEERLRKTYAMAADVLKVSHHGSRFSSGERFINEVKPRVAVFEVGNNSYGHPHPTVVERLARAGSRTYATREQGTIKMTVTGNTLTIMTRK